MKERKSTMKDLQGRVAMVTGAASGIGNGIAMSPAHHPWAA
jgi:NAD(P)-dependent dehydrogenase (short-subunit alcohol dehydrogenase family)